MAEKNVKVTTDKNGVMTIKVDTSKEFGPSKSGKTIVIATTGGNIRVGDVFVGVNVYKYAEPRD